MDKYVRNIVVLVTPFLLMIGVNEFTRTTVTEKPYSSHGITAINAADRILEKCTWVCHNNTSYCKENHVKYLKANFELTDAVYFGVIDLLRSTGNYVLANIVFLVIGMPLILWLLLIKSARIQDEITKLKKENE